MILRLDTPVETLTLPELQPFGVEVLLKRDDLIHPFISGNKWRKLKGYVEHAQQAGVDTLVSFGGPWSNHLVALACAGAAEGFNTVAFVRGEQVNNPSLGLCRFFGMELRFISREAYRNKQALFAEHFGSNPSALFIDEGGKGEYAMPGCAAILEEVSDFSHVVCAVGTGTTLAGIARAAFAKQIQPEGIVVLKGASDLDAVVEQMAGGPVKLHHDFHQGGYARTTPGLIAFLEGVARRSGILFDQVYTGKMLFAVCELIKAGYYKRGDRLLLIHTGGLTGMMSLFGQAD